MEKNILPAASIPDLSEASYQLNGLSYKTSFRHLPAWLKDLLEIGIMEAARRAKRGDQRAAELCREAALNGIKKLVFRPFPSPPSPSKTIKEEFPVKSCPIRS